MKKLNNVIWGVIIVALGVLLGLRALDILDFTIFFDGWWTLFIIIPCAAGLFTNSDKTGSLIGLLIGVALLLGCQDILDFKIIWKLAAPIVIVMIGLSMIFKSSRNMGETKRITDGSKAISYTAMFSGKNMNYAGESFDGVELTAVFGGMECDLRNAVIEDGAVINVSAVFGGIDLIVPDNVNVKVNVSALFGGVNNKRHLNSINNSTTIYINGTCMFGGVDVK